MSDISYLIAELVQYGETNGLICKDDTVYTINKLLELFRETTYTAPVQPIPPRNLHLILQDMLNIAISHKVLCTDTITYRDLFDTAIMGQITPPPSTVRQNFHTLYKQSPQEATTFYYAFSKATNYIRVDRIVKDEKWVSATEFGNLDITINLSKPEKDPRDIAAAGKAPQSGYPPCVLCMENEGYAGHLTRQARQNHRIIPIELDGERYYLQYSPYVYYNEHCIILNEKHIPMIIDRATIRKLLCFITQFPHYTAGSNADIPIVGGSILSHDHFQGGRYEFPMVRAPYEVEFEIKGFADVRSGIIKWPLSTIRLQGKEVERVVELADHILTRWRGYSDEEVFVFSQTDGIPHNSITPIARMRKCGNNGEEEEKKEVYELDLVLRNNITTAEHPLGVYHPHSQWHHIKKENIGLIEVMGLAILPARLKKELAMVEEAIVMGTDLFTTPATSVHAQWAIEFLPRYGYTVSVEGKEGEGEGMHARVTGQPEGVDRAKLHSIVRDEVGLVFAEVLKDAGVYKRTPDGMKAFMKFISTLSQ